MKFHYRYNFIPAVLLLLLATFSSMAGYGLPVTGLYNHEIPVRNDSIAEVNRALREALAAVIVKVTGQTRWLDDSLLAAALGRAQDYVEQRAYRSETVETAMNQQQDTVAVSDDLPSLDLEPAVQTAEQLYINFSFSRTAINELLAVAGAPVWDSNRPSVLLWMVLQDDQGQRSLLGDESNQEVLNSIVDIARQRGLPVIFPVLDFEDRRNLSINQLWDLDENAIRLASSRYAADSVLAGRLFTTVSGELVGRWQFIFQNSAESFDGFDIDLEQYLYQPLDRVTSQLAGHFAVLRTDSSAQNVRLRIEGVNDLSTYSTVLNYLQGLGIVETVDVAQLDGQSLELELDLVGDQQQLLEMISLDRDMTPIRSVVTENPNRLHYRWIR